MNKMWPAAGRLFRQVNWLMLLIVVIWGLNLSLVKLALAEIPSMPFNGLRLPLASLILLAACALTGEPLRVEKRHWFRIVLLAITGHTIYQFLFIVGVHHTTASNTAVLFGSAPVFIALLSVYFKHERLRPRGWAGVALGFAGIYTVIQGRSGGFRLDPDTMTGDGLIFLAVLLWSHYTVSSRPLLKRYSPLQFTTLTMTIGSLLFLPMTARDLLELPYQAISWQAWGCLAFSGAVALSLAVSLWFVSVRRVGNSQTAAYSNLQPVMSILFAHLLLGEKMTLSLLAGAVIIFAAIFFLHTGRERGTS